MASHPDSADSHPPPTRAERPDFTDAIILRKGASVEHVVSETCLGQGWGAPPVPSGSCPMSSGPSADPQPRAVRHWACIPPPGCSQGCGAASMGWAWACCLAQGCQGSSGRHHPVTSELPGPRGPPDVKSGKLPPWTIPGGSFQVVYPKCWTFHMPPTPGDCFLHPLTRESLCLSKEHHCLPESGTLWLADSSPPTPELNSPRWGGTAVTKGWGHSLLTQVPLGAGPPCRCPLHLPWAQTPTLSGPRPPAPEVVGLQPCQKGKQRSWEQKSVPGNGWQVQRPRGRSNRGVWAVCCQLARRAQGRGLLQRGLGLGPGRPALQGLAPWDACPSEGAAVRVAALARGAEGLF